MAVDQLEHRVTSFEYHHARLETRRNILRFLLKQFGFTLLAKIDSVTGMENVPAEGPAILMINHIAFIDPIVVLHLLPRNITPLAKAEVYDYPVVGIIPKIWQVIPVRREEFDRRAVAQVLQILQAGEIVLVAPEGTRGPALKQGKEGIAYLASRSGAPVVPVAVDGTEGFPSLRFFSPAWREAGARVVFGRPFRYRADYRHARQEQLRQMTDEAMYVLAGLLPEHRRGCYADFSRASQHTIEWL
jgi:1-acyl-sn-glycerol-3-phosphate acyltransferase